MQCGMDNNQSAGSVNPGIQSQASRDTTCASPRRYGKIFLTVKCYFVLKDLRQAVCFAKNEDAVTNWITVDDHYAT